MNAGECRSHPAISALLLVLLIDAIASIAVAQNQQCKPLVPINRDLHDYECGGIHVGGLFPPAVPIPDAEAATREYVWQHYRSKQRAYVSLETHTNEGDYTDISFYIHPGDDDRWLVVWTGERHMGSRRKRRMLPVEPFQGTAESIQRITPERSVLADSAVLPGNSYRLLFLDAKGIVVQEL